MSEQIVEPTRTTISLLTNTVQRLRMLRFKISIRDGSKSTTNDDVVNELLDYWQEGHSE
jgi:hypothetical protein